MTTVAKPKTDPATILIPLNRLKKSPKNVRKVKHTKADIEAYAASIAANGLLQNLVVETEANAKGKPTGFYLVTAGEGRRLAYLLRAKRGEVKATEPVRCVLADGSAEEISLAENILRAPMHPADQYEAFAKLHHEQEMPVEDIAARFGVTPAVVAQRLKLGSVAPKLIKLYRDGEVTLEQLMAFTITDDHKAQLRVWKELPKFNRSRRAILEALTEQKVPCDDRRAILVGVEAYADAGGTITRNLFDAGNGGYLDDPELLNRLVRDKLQRKAAKVMAEGWKWVSVEIEFDREGASHMRRVNPALSPDDQATLAELNAKLEAAWDSEDDNSVEIEWLQGEIDRVGAREMFAPEDVARSGAFVSLDGEGLVVIRRGYLRPEDAAPKAEAGEDAEAAEAEDTLTAKIMPDSLLAELTAHRTAALRQELAMNPAAGLIAAVHALAAQCFYHRGDCSCLAIRLVEPPLHPHDRGIGDSLAAQRLQERRDQWAKSLPRSVDGLWDYVCALDQDDRLTLLALCVATSIDAVQVKAADKSAALVHADTLAASLRLDMSKFWQPTAASYFGRVSKDRVAEALREAGGSDVPLAIFDMKKAAMAEAAGGFMKGRNWLPAPLRTA